jgi:hypothetical protein
VGEQKSLFSETQIRDWQRPSVKSAAPLYFSKADLSHWKQRVHRFQQQVSQQHQQPLQQSLLGATHSSPALIDPFSLPQQNTEFWRQHTLLPGVAALYFVIDAEVPLLLYVGETCDSNARWQGVHDCKRYLANYVACHRQHQVPVAVYISFWNQAPKATRARQKLEQCLIQQWRSPFNKENWQHWGAPFQGTKY